jgi:glycosyltransferase involved in cell wall biosynthesis
MGADRPRLLHLTTVDLSLHALLANQLRRFAEEGFEVIGAAAPTGYAKALREDGVDFRPVASLSRSWSPLADVGALSDLVRLFRDLRPDIVHTHNPKSGVLGRVAARLARVPVIVNTVHGLYANPGLPPVRRRLIAAAEWSAARLSHHEFFQSAEDYDTAIGNRMVTAKSASILGNGVDLGRFSRERVPDEAVTALRESWGAGPDDVVVGTVGRLVREKGLTEFIEVASALSTRAKFVIVGPEDHQKADRLTGADIAAAREAGVIFHGEADDMPPVYAAMDLFVLASYREGMPRSAIEAGAMGLPSVATDIRGCREVIEDGVTGVLVPARDAAALVGSVESLVTAQDRRLDMGQAAILRVGDRFDEEQVISRSLNVYRQLIWER